MCRPAQVQWRNQPDLCYLYGAFVMIMHLVRCADAAIDQDILEGMYSSYQYLMDIVATRAQQQCEKTLHKLHPADARSVSQVQGTMPPCML